MLDSSHKTRSLKSVFLLSLTALGIVYGDIGTSPLYAINEIFFGHKHANTHFSSEYIIGAISLVVWALTIIVTFKYIIFVLRADNDGEGGVFALYGLLDKLKTRTKLIISSLLIIAAGLLFGDGIITPAISVISAVEGLSIATSSFQPYVVPITIAILTGLFLVQKKGTAKVGSVFGPIVIIWFISITLIGLTQLLHTPSILAAINPIYAVKLIMSNSIHNIFLVLGSVMLVVTGGEAMYADMGHFGRLPIRLSWTSIVYPSLLINYLGQGAYMLSGQHVVGNNIFYSMVPSWGLIPMVIIATLATVIASQALISGAFSLAQQAVSLGLFPYLKIVHTHHAHEGQIYVPFVNYSLYVGCVLLVLKFQSSGNLAAAYGLAVSGVMLVTSLAMILVAHHYWKWSMAKTLALFIPLSLIDLTFLSANSLKVFEGGYIPLAIGICLLIILKTWQWGRKKITDTYLKYPSLSVADIIKIKKETSAYLPRTIVFMTPQKIEHKSDIIPAIKQMFWERYGLLPQNLIFLTVQIQKDPYIHSNRYEVNNLYEDPKKGSILGITLNYGYMEEQNVEASLSRLSEQIKEIIHDDYKNWTIHILHERIQPVNRQTWFVKLRYALFKFMLKNSDSADYFFGLGKQQPLSIEVIPVRI